VSRTDKNPFQFKPAESARWRLRALWLTHPALYCDWHRLAAIRNEIKNFLAQVRDFADT
jgi:hypothetical protein